MRNLVFETPNTELHGRLRRTGSFVLTADLQGSAILDVGCGFGWFELVALEGGARAVTGVEPTEADLKTVRSSLQDDRLHVEVASAIDLPFEQESFDTVAGWEVLEHLPRRSEAAAFGEFHRVLRPGGALYLSTPHATPLAMLADPAWWLIGHRHYSRNAVSRFAQAAGFVVEELETYGGHWEIAGLLDMYVAKWVLRRPPVLARFLKPKIEREWSRPGFTNVFLRCRKPIATNGVRTSIWATP